ncbi:MAG: response regulator transcription factor [Leptolyngbyaceae cyanobacterium bins.302]|nr:response regulator transcription factor [Leptolyngbyaceae cyanobacterium bins.302]
MNSVVKPIEVEPLTRREVQVLELMAEGLSNPQIGQQLFISAGTVKSHVGNILRKLCADTRTEATSRALKSHLFERYQRTK